MSDPVPHARLFFVNRYYWPDEQATAQMLADLGTGLVKRGWPVTVIASHDGRAATPLRETRDGVDIVRLPVARSGRHGIAAKARDYLSFALASRRALRASLRAGDQLIAMTDPPALAPIAAAAARRARAGLVHWIQDIHPEISLALSGSRLLAALSRPWSRWRDRAWRNARACVTVGRDLRALILEHGVAPAQVHVIPNWAPEGLAPAADAAIGLRDQWGVTEKFIIGYAGNLGRVHALEPILGAAGLLPTDSRFVYLMVGDGPQRPALEAAVRQQRLANVQFLPAQPRLRLAGALSAIDLHLVTLRAGCERCVFPSKLYGIAAVGRPVAFLGPAQCEVAEIIRGQGFGVIVSPDEPAELAAAAHALRDEAGRRQAMAQAAAAWSRATGGLPAALDAWEDRLGTGQLPLAVESPPRP